MHHVGKLLSAWHADGSTGELRGQAHCPLHAQWSWLLLHHRCQLQGKKVLEDLYSGLDVVNLFEERLICSPQAGWLGSDRALPDRLRRLRCELRGSEPE